MVKHALIMATLFSTVLAHLPTTHPRFVNVNSSHLNYINTVVQNNMTDKTIDGAVVIAARDGKIFYKETFGKNATNTQPSFMHDLITNIAIFMLAERGQICITEHLINKSIEKKSYHTLVEETTKMPLDAFTQQYLFQPLGIAAETLSSLSALDLVAIGHMLLCNGMYNETAILTSAAARVISSNLKEKIHHAPSSQRIFLGDNFMPQAFGIADRYSSLLMDPEKNIVLVVVTSSADSEDKKKPITTSGRVANIIAAAIKEPKMAQK